MGTTSFAFGLCLAAVGATALDDAWPSYAVAPETVLKREYKSSTKLESEPAKMFLDDEEVPTEGHGSLRLRVEDSRTIAFTDTIGAVADGRPTKFTREFGDMENSATETAVTTPPGGTEDVKASTRERTSPLSGQTVVFTWDAAKEEYARALAGADAEKKSADAELLEELQPDAEWLPLLEGGPREKGASFELDPKLFERIQYPAGELHWKVEGKDADPISRSINEQLSENLEGKARATWQGAREVDGRELSVFTIEATLKSKAEAETADGVETRGVELELEYEGEILWDVAAGRLAGYALEADVRSVLSTTRPMQTQEGKRELRRVFDLRGTAKHGLTVGVE